MSSVGLLLLLLIILLLNGCGTVSHKQKLLVCVLFCIATDVEHDSATEVPKIKAPKGPD